MATRIPLLLLILMSLIVDNTAVADNDYDHFPVVLFPDGFGDDFTSRYVGKYDDFGACVGIDLGHSHTRFGVERNGILEIIPNDLGETKTPNWISFAEDGTILVGKAAVNQSSPNTPVFDIKHLVGRGFDDPEIVNKSGKPYVRVGIGGETKELNPEDLFAAFLWKIKDMAENHLSKRIRKAILVVPVSYEDEHRSAVKKMARRVGFGEARVYGHPMAAVVAQKSYDEYGQSKYLVFRLGRGKCEANVVGSDNGVFESLARKCDANLGGKEFDRRLMNHFVGLIRSKYGRDIGGDRTALEKLAEESEKAKMALSSQDRAVLEIESLNFSEPLTRALLEEINEDLFDSMRVLVETALEESGLKKADIDGVVLVGASTRIPKVRKLFKDLFDWKEQDSNVNPDEVLVKGALAIFQLLRRDYPGVLFSPLRYATPISTGIQTFRGEMTKLVMGRSGTPTRKKALFTTNRDNQSTVEIKVLAGEKRLAQDCLEIGSFNLSGIFPAPRGVPRIEISFQFVDNDIFYVKADDKASSVSVSKLFGFGVSAWTKLDRTLEEYVEEEDRMYWLAKPKTPQFILENW